MHTKSSMDSQNNKCVDIRCKQRIGQGANKNSPIFSQQPKIHCGLGINHQILDIR